MTKTCKAHGKPVCDGTNTCETPHAEMCHHTHKGECITLEPIPDVPNMPPPPQVRELPVAWWHARAAAALGADPAPTTVIVLGTVGPVALCIRHPEYRVETIERREVLALPLARLAWKETK